MKSVEVNWLTDQARSPVLKPFVGKARHERGQLGVNGLFDQLAHAVADDIGELVV